MNDYDIDLVCSCCDSCVESFYETYNRSHMYYEYLDSEMGIRWIYGKKYDEIKERVEKFIELMGTDISNAVDGWDGNCTGLAGKNMKLILDTAEEYPNCIFEGD